MMSMADRARRGGEAMARRYAERAETLWTELARGESLKRAAHTAGIAVRTARRRLRQLEAMNGQWTFAVVRARRARAAIGLPVAMSTPKARQRRRFTRLDSVKTRIEA